MPLIAELMSRHAGAGRIEWIGLRPERREPLKIVEDVEIAMGGLVGDRRNTPGKRAVTLIQWEHLDVIAALVRQTKIDPAALRRNIAISGLNLMAVRNHGIRIGEAILSITGICAPCSRMEEVLGNGGYNAVRGHGGVTAEVLTPGRIAVGSAVDPWRSKGGPGQ